jgi:tetratricopeptide (TPR) repeat protein
MPHGRPSAFRPITELLREYFELDARGDVPAIRETVAQRLQVLDPVLASALPAFLDLLRVPVDDADWRAAEPARRRERMLDAVRRLVLQASRQQPILLVLEDLHWVDSQTQDVLDRLTEILPAACVLVLITYRPEYRHRWGEKDCYTEVLVDPLPRDSSQAMLGGLLGADASLAPLKGRLIDKTEGNPFFLEECVKGLVASGALVGKAGAYRLITELDSIDIPVTVQAVLAARIDLLPLDCKWILQTAAVIGRRLSLRLLTSVAELPEDTARDGVARLQAAAFLVETAAFPEAEYAFPHALTQEVAYRSVLAPRRRAVHARMVQALEQLHGHDRMQHAELLGHHAVRGECWAAAVAYLREAGVRAASRSEYAEAVAFFKESLRAAEHLPPDAERWAREIDIRFEIRNALWARGRLVEGLDHLREAEPIAARLGDQRRLTRLMAHTRSNYLILGDNERALEYGHEVLTRARKLDDFALQIDANQYLGVLYTSLGDFRAALEYLDANVGRLVGERRQGAFGDFFAVHGRTWRVWCLSELGRFDDAAACVAEAVEIAEQAGHAQNVVAASWAAGYLDCMRGRPGPAAQVLERAYALCEASGIAVWLRPSAALLGHAWASGGRFTEAVRVLEQAVQPAENNVAAAAWKVYLAEAYLMAGRPDAAEGMVREGLALAQRRKETGFAGHAFCVLAEIQASMSRSRDAVVHYQQALQLAVERGMLPLAARCHVGLADMAPPAEAARHAALADDMARRMGLDRAARTLAARPLPA